MTVPLRIHTEKGGMLPDIYPESFQFPGGEWHLRNLPELPTDQGQVTLIADWRGADPNDLVKAALWADVAHSSVVNMTSVRFVLMVPYLPAARADRGKPLGIAAYARLIRSLNADRIFTLDPHSVRSLSVYSLAGMRVVDMLPLIKQASDGQHWDGIIAPDKGAVRRAQAVADMMGLPLYTCDKTRDFETGKILDLKVPTLNHAERYLVVDDICDGGGTFQWLADKTHLPRTQLGLWVTHGIFSGNADHLRHHYGWIGTTDSHPGCYRVGVATTIVPCFQTMFNEMRK